MDFFDHQERARKSSHILILYFCLAVLGILLAVYALAAGVTYFIDGDFSRGQSIDLWQPDLLAISSVLAGSAIFLASGFKTMQLNGGGKVVARELGGRPLDVHSTDFHERRLLNLVEEMAIASGVPVPEVYVMDSEDSINAFAAGKATSDAVIGVTRGCMKLLSREELQGVIAHEFSHILNGDMKLNMRLIGMLFGILFLTLIGEIILRSTFYAGRGSRNREGGGAVLVILVAGIGLIIIGYVGTFFANLIKASISRQREYLADASAVQFTRNPDGIAGALKKIGALSQGSTISNPMARDASHLFFGSALSGDLMATHPPLSDRIKRLLPHWDGDFGTLELAPITGSQDADDTAIEQKKASTIPGMPIPGVLLAGNESSVKLTESEAEESMKSLHFEQIDLGHGIHKNLPGEWIAAAQTESGAQAIVFAMLLVNDEDLRNNELSRLKNHLDPLTYEKVIEFYRQFRELHSAVKLALIDLAIPALRHLSPTEYQRFRNILNDLVASDQVVDLFEFTVQRMVARHLDTYFGHSRPPSVKYHKLNPVLHECSLLLSTLAAFSNPEDSELIQKSFAHAADHIRKVSGKTIEFQPADQCGLDNLARAMDALARCTPMMKREFLLACSKSALTDGVLSSKEAELIRAVADAIGCAIPPFVRTAPLSDPT